MAIAILNIVATLLGATISALSLLAQTLFWQRKEYRFDRALAQWDEINWHSEPVLKLIPVLFLVLLAWLLYLLDLIASANVLGWVSLIAIAIYSFQRTYHRGIYRPKFTVRAKLLLSTCTIALCFLIVATLQPNVVFALQWVSFILVVPLLAYTFNQLIAPLFYLKKKHTIRLASAVRAQKKLFIIGITGSYGKTTTKYFLRELLQSSQHNVHLSSGRRNEAYAVALDFLATPLKDGDIYICEMGAYRTGEIATLARMLRPSLAIVTAITNQHLALFGSPEQLASAKWELIQALPTDGLAVLNIDHPAIRARADQLLLHRVTYSSQTQADVVARDITYHADSTTMTICCGNSCETITLPLPGEGNAAGALAATAAAFAYGIAPTVIFKSLPNLHPVPQTMQIKTGQNGVTILDDSYSANEVSVLSAIKHIGRYNAKHKIIVLTPLIELGPASASVHQAIGRALALSQATVYINGTNHQTDIKQGFAQHSTRAELKFFAQPEPMVTQLTSHLLPDTVILLEGRLPRPIHQALLA